MTAKQLLYLVTGAPGAGKPTTVEVLLGLESPYTFFDIDWLAASASALYGQDVRFAPESWEVYGDLWWSVLTAAVKNAQVPVLFTPADPGDYRNKTLPEWCGGAQWLLLDCADEVRLERLQQRGWSGERLDETFQDAELLRKTVTRHIDTGKLTANEVAKQVLLWLKETSQPHV